jgi:aspartate aminotransferase-like enzyme/GNAT superfamily N-acetyltransferase
MQRYRIKLAQTEAERSQIYEFNYATFVEEIPQHGPNPERRLVDRFDGENEYVIAISSNERVIGMLALRAQRPFSLDQKLAHLDDHLPPHRSVCELRLLTVRPEYRGTRLLRDLLAFTVQRCVAAGHDLAVISGTTRQLALYQHIGFEPFGPLVGTAQALFQPMYLRLERLLSCTGTSLGVGREQRRLPAGASFLPGPANASALVRAALSGATVTHRSPRFVAQVERVRSRLCELTGAADAAVMVGSGTLANDVVAGGIRSLQGCGLVLANGEFGERLVGHARGATLAFDVLRRSWGTPFDEAEIVDGLRRIGARWIWAVHCETSTGVLADIAMLRRAAAQAEAVLCLDCISSIGTLPVNLGGVWLTSGTSGKGLAACPGLAIVLLNGVPPRRCSPVPRYLDLEYWLHQDSVPFTHSSNLVAALEVALAGTDWEACFRETARDARWLRIALCALGLKIVAPESSASPGVVTIRLPSRSSSAEVAGGLEQDGFEIAWRSDYLSWRNWIQIALMGDYDRIALRLLPAAIARQVRVCAGHPSRAAPEPASGTTPETPPVRAIELRSHWK